MKISENPVIDVILKIIGAGVVLFILNKIANIFKGSDKKFSVSEFGKFIGFFVFTGLGIHMILKEGTREHEWHYYSETYIFFIISAMLTVLHLDAALDKFVKILELALKLRSKGVSITSEETTEKKTEKKTEEIIIDEGKL